jgi:hypothetical protein
VDTNLISYSTAGLTVSRRSHHRKLSPYPQVSERDRETERDRERQRETERQRQRERQREMEREMERERETEAESETNAESAGDSETIERENIDPSFICSSVAHGMHSNRSYPSAPTRCSLSRTTPTCKSGV